MIATMSTPDKISKDAPQVAEGLLKIGSVRLQVNDPFTWVSGISSPIYCDNRLVNSNVEVRRNLVNYFVDLIKENFKEVEVIAGVATGGIPLGVLVADKLNLPFIYPRQEAKKHGLKKQVEGYFEVGQKVVLIEDHISTGGSSIVAINALKDVGLEVLGLISIMTYGFEVAKDKFKDNNINFYSLCDLDTILDVSLKQGTINILERDSILSFRSNPEGWRKNK